MFIRLCFEPGHQHARFAPALFRIAAIVESFRIFHRTLTRRIAAPASSTAIYLVQS